MRVFTSMTGIAAPLPMENVDTDKILPGRFLTTISRSGLGDGLFADLRKDPDFILNRDPWRARASILVALGNFGCGSSREHAPWALLDFGFRCIIAASFADIFYFNCFKNGILPIVLPRPMVEMLLELASCPETAELNIDLLAQTINPITGTPIPFEIEARRKGDLMAGTDEIARTLGLGTSIATFETQRAERFPWLGELPSVKGL